MLLVQRPKLNHNARQILAAAAGFDSHGIGIIREPLSSPVFTLRLKTWQISAGLNQHIGPNVFLPLGIPRVILVVCK